MQKVSSDVLIQAARPGWMLPVGQMSASISRTTACTLVKQPSGRFEARLVATVAKNIQTAAFDIFDIENIRIAPVDARTLASIADMRHGAAIAKYA